MREMPGPVLEDTESPPLELHLLVVPEPWSRIFTQNLRDLFRPSGTPFRLHSSPAPFWADVFVERKLPWRRFLESGGYHIIAIALIWAGSRFLVLQPHVTPLPTFTRADVVYYTPSEYLPPLDTRHSHSTHARKADPEFSVQPIISVPPEADNRLQTVVTPPKVRLRQEVALPNTVAWTDTPRMPVAPAPLVPASEISRLAPNMERSVIAPPPALNADSHRRVGEIEVGHSAVIAPAPQLALDEQHATLGRSSALRGHAPQVVAPPPVVGMQRGSRSAGMIALSLHPAVGAPPAAVAGNRRGSFAATSAGHRGASGEAGAAATSSKDGSVAGTKSSGNLPSGLYVGKSESANSVNSNSVNPRLIAGLRAPRLQTPQAESGSKISEAERAVFGGRKVYSLSLNMPNLNSAGGSWIIRFAALKADSVTSGESSSGSAAAELSSPVATRKVDPAYPLELMKQNVSGTVILYAVILADGTVGRVRVLRSVDERIDRFASEAIAKWQFQPATKNGDPVAVEATFWIPFRPVKTTSDF
ncbi:MAG: energy transducer TonB [Candidatus Sulfotelmatobacter sp.]